MIRRLYYSILKPSRIALFIKDNVLLSLLYFLLLFVISISPQIITYTNTNKDIDQASYAYIVSQIPQDTNARFESGKLLCDNPFVVVDKKGYKYSFGKTDSIDTKTIFFSMQEDSFTVYNVGTIYGTYKYDSLNISDFKFSDVFTNSGVYYQFKNVFNAIYHKYLNYSPLEYTAALAFNVFLDLLFAGLVLYMISWFRSPFLETKHKMNLTLYSLTWTFIGLFLDGYFRLSILRYIGFGFSFICLVRALSVIKVVKVPRG